MRSRIAAIKMRRDLVLMGTFAAIVGIGLAAAMTAALGVRSSGPPAPLKVATVAPATTAVKAPIAVAKPKVAHKVVHKQAHKRRHRVHRRHVRKVAPAPAPTRVVAQAPAPTRVQAPVQRQTAPVSTPAPAPRPARPVSSPKPKHSGGGKPGVAFDDSG
jgi:hypothetical protein